MKRIGVTGAFGFLGANFLKVLLDEGRSLGFPEDEWEIVAFRSKSSSHPFFSEPEISGSFRKRVSAESLDILDSGSMARLFAGLDAVAHFAGLVDYRESMKRRVWDADVLGTKAVFDAVLEARVPKLLYVSSICVFGSGAFSRAPGPPRFCDESSIPYGDPSWPTSFAAPREALEAVRSSLKGDYRFLDGVRVAYLDSKIAGWELAKEYAAEKGLPAVTVFPGTAVGAGDVHRGISKLVDEVWEGRMRLSVTGSTSFVPARDFARGAALALAKGRIGEGYILSGREEQNLSYAGFQELVAKIACGGGWFARLRPLPLAPWPVYTIATLAEALVPDFGLTKAMAICSGLESLTCSSAKALAELGYESGQSLESAILECRSFSEALRAASAAAKAIA